MKAIIIKDGRILVLKCRDSEGVWYLLPGGGQEVGETLEQALHRECVEELGCKVRMGRLRFIRDYIAKNHEFAATDPDTHAVELMFQCELESEPTIAIEPDKNQEGFEWLDVTKLQGCRLYPRVLEQALCSVESAGVRYFGDVN